MLYVLCFLIFSVVSDCGIYVIYIAEVLCKRLQDKVSSEHILQNEVNAESVRRKRTEIKKIIKELRETHPC